MKRLTALAALLLLLVLPTQSPRWLDTAPAPPSESLSVFHGSFGRNDSLATVLGGHLSPAGVHHLAEAARPVYDLARVSVGRPFALALGARRSARAFTYGIDELQTLRVIRQGDALEAEVLTRTYDTRVEVIEGEIESSLFATIAAIGEHDQLAFDLSEIFAWDIDFNTEIQTGDAFRVAVEKLSLDDRFVRYGRILAGGLRPGREDALRGAIRRSPGGGLLRPGRHTSQEGVPSFSASLHADLVAFHQQAAPPRPEGPARSPGHRLRRAHGDTGLGFGRRCRDPRGNVGRAGPGRSPAPCKRATRRSTGTSPAST